MNIRKYECTSCAGLVEYDAKSKEYRCMYCGSLFDFNKSSRTIKINFSQNITGFKSANASLFNFINYNLRQGRFAEAERDLENLMRTTSDIPEVYLLKIMINRKVREEAELGKQIVPLEEEFDYGWINQNVKSNKAYIPVANCVRTYNRIIVDRNKRYEELPGIIKEKEDYLKSIESITKAGLSQLSDTMAEEFNFDVEKPDNAVVSLLEDVLSETGKIGGILLLSTAIQNMREYALTKRDINDLKQELDELREFYGEKRSENIVTINDLPKATLRSIIKDGFGTYGGQPIKWKILRRYLDRNLSLLVAENAIDSKIYNKEAMAAGKDAWNDSDVANWLNNEFVKEAFTEDELDLIDARTIRNVPCKLFLLSVNDAQKLFDKDSDRICTATEYAKAQGVYANAADGSCPWMLRKSSDNNLLPVVTLEGQIENEDTSDATLDSEAYGIRPAMYIKLSKMD